MVSDARHSDDYPPPPDSIEVGAVEMAWSQAWQIPVLLLGLGLFVIGAFFAVPRYSAPDYPGVLNDVAVHLDKLELEQAEEKLDTLLADPVFNEKADDALKAHVWQLYGDLRFQQIDKRVWQGITTEVGQENLGTIASHYRDAERLGRELPVPALRRYAETLAALGKDEAALQVIDEMPADMEPPRYSLVRDLIERQVQTDPDPESDKLTRLIKRFEQELDLESESDTKRDQHIWIAAIKAERMLQAGDANGVIDLLVHGGLHGLYHRRATPQDLAPLTVRLGEAYAQLGKHEVARGHLSEAQRHLPPGDSLIPRIMVAFGDITLAQGHSGAFELANSHYRQAYDTDKMGPSSIKAIIGLGHTEANRDGRFPEALGWFKLAVDRMINDQVPAWDPLRTRLAHYMRDIHVVREYERGRYAEALELLQAYEPLERPKLSSSTLLTFAMIYEALGNRALKLAASVNASDNSPGTDPRLQARRLHNQDAALAFEQAADYYRRQAGELTHTTDEHGEALWKSAKNYEQAQLWGEAVEVYSEFLESSDNGDKREEATYRIAQALLAEDQPKAAVARLREIIETSPTGKWALASYVPMAQGLQATGEWKEAESLLRSVIEQHPSIGPDSPYYHDALLAMGHLFYTRGAEDPRYYARAIEVLGSDGGAVERYERDERYQDEMPVLHYMLADCLRLSASGLIESAQLARTETERLAMLTERKRRLSDAKIYYNKVVVELEPWHTDAFSQIQLLYFRNAHFYQADCAYELGDYETAIGLYLNAVSRWQDHPAALVGWVQIMNARAELGQIEGARSAHAQAIELFNKMPEGAFKRADSLMTRERWDAWLQWMNQLDLFKTAGVDAD